MWRLRRRHLLRSWPLPSRSNPSSALQPPPTGSVRYLPRRRHSFGGGPFGRSFPMTPGLRVRAFGSRRFSTSPPGCADRCWNCGAGAGDGPFLACGSCRSVQPVDPSIDYFQIFELEKNYELMDQNLQGKYKDWQKKLHPDLFHSKSEKERNYAAEQSGRVTNAYRTLSKPLSRAMYLLKIEGVHVDEEKTISDPELLAEIMEIRESVDEANDLGSLKKIQAGLHKKFDEWSDFFGDAFKKQNFEEAKTAILRMTYYERAIEEIVKKL